MALTPADHDAYRTYPIAVALNEELCWSVSDHATQGLRTYQDAGED